MGRVSHFPRILRRKAHFFRHCFACTSLNEIIHEQEDIYNYLEYDYLARMKVARLENILQLSLEADT